MTMSPVLFIADDLRHLGPEPALLNHQELAAEEKSAEYVRATQPPQSISAASEEVISSVRSERPCVIILPVTPPPLSYLPRKFRLPTEWRRPDHLHRFRNAHRIGFAVDGHDGGKPLPEGRSRYTGNGPPLKPFVLALTLGI